MEYNNTINEYNISITSQEDYFPSRGGGSVSINSQPLKAWIERNYFNTADDSKVITTHLVNGELELICDTFFKAIKDIRENQNDYTSANNLADYFFNQFHPIWGTFRNIYDSFQEIDLWNHILDEVHEWEEQNNFKIKKSIPFFRNTTNFLDIGNFDFAFYYAHKSLEEDKDHCLKENPNYDYHTSPAFLFVSMNMEKRQYLYWTIRDFVKKLEEFIDKYNNRFNENFSYQIMKNRFFSNYTEFEDEILYFTYLFMTRFYKVYNIETFELYDNEFAKMRNLNYILSFCILIDQILGKRINATNTKETFFSYKSYKLIEQLSNGLFSEQSNQDRKFIKKKVRFYKSSLYFSYPKLSTRSIKFMLKRNKKIYPFNSSYTDKENKKIINTMLIYFLRNHGAHDLKLEYLDTKTFQDLLEALLFQIFIVIQTLL
ncbi:MAG: hypothetical protein ACFFC3_07520 [Candidatus Odinarchaeota archaeon]